MTHEPNHPVKGGEEEKLREPGQPVLTEPLLVTALHEDGRLVDVDVMHLLATCKYFRKTAKAAFEKLFADNFPANNVVQIGLVLKDGDGLEQECILVLPERDDASVIEWSSPDLWDEDPE